MFNALHDDDLRYMNRAIQLADQAAALGEIPVGALVVHENRVVSEAYNLKEGPQDPLGHAEVLALRRAATALGRWRLSGCTLYVTLEPCLMCSGAIVHSRVDRVVFGARDAKAGAVCSLYQILDDARLNHRPQVTGDVMGDECRTQLQAFFKDLRQARMPDRT